MSDNPEFDPLTIRRAAAEVPCDLRSYRKELREPGSVRGIIGVLIRRHIAATRARAHASAKEVKS